MELQRIAAFSKGGTGGNPAGVVILKEAISKEKMAQVAADVGYSETAFAVATDNSGKNWRVRYFSPESEVPFCGHATIALGAAIAQQNGPGVYALSLNEASITVEAGISEEGMFATLTSPPTRSRAISDDEFKDIMSLFSLCKEDLDPRIPPARIHGGADHVVLPLNKRSKLSEMNYNLNLGRDLMRKHNLVTIMLVVIKDNQTFDARNAFASGGVVEDPATGAAAAALAGYLRDRDWPHGGKFVIHQGEDMGSPSLINVMLSEKKGSPVRVSGFSRKI